MRNSSWLSFLAGLALVAAGPGALAQRKPDLEPRKGEGLVLLKVVSLGPIKWAAATLESKRGQPIDLYDHSDPFAAGAVYVDRLDEGEYDFVRLFKLGNMAGLLPALILASELEMRGRIPPFTVQGGSLTNLGTLVVLPPAEKGEPPQVVHLGGPAGRKSALDDLERRVGRRVELPVAGGEMTAEAEKESIARARGMVRILSLGDDAQGSGMIGGGALGMIAARKPGGRWQVETLDTLDDVRYARRLADGTLIAGLVQGRYAVRRPGAGWTLVALPQPDAVVTHVDPTPDGGALVVASTWKATAVLHRASLDAAEAPLREVAAFDFPYALRPNPALSLDDRLMLIENPPGFSRVREVTSIDKKSLQVSKAKFDFWIRSWQQLPTGEIVISRQNGMSYYTGVSSDKGATWQHNENEGPTQARFIDRQLGYGIKGTPGAFSVDVRLMKTTDGGRTWAMLGQATTRKVTGRIVFAGEGELILASPYEMYTTRDEGATWSTVVLRAD